MTASMGSMKSTERMDTITTTTTSTTSKRTTTSTSMVLQGRIMRYCLSMTCLLRLLNIWRLPRKWQHCPRVGVFCFCESSSGTLIYSPTTSRTWISTGPRSGTNHRINYQITSKLIMALAKYAASNPSSIITFVIMVFAKIAGNPTFKRTFSPTTPFWSVWTVSVPYSTKPC